MALLMIRYLLAAIFFMAAPLAGQSWDYELTAWSASVSQATALNNTGLRFSEAVGWGAEPLPCQAAYSDEGTSSKAMVWIVDNTASSGTGSQTAAWDSIAANDAETTCHYVLFTVGGQYSNVSGNYDDLRNVRWVGQAAQGIVYMGKQPRRRRSQGHSYEYLSSRYTGDTSQAWTTDDYCSSYTYYLHTSTAWGASNNHNRAGCGTENVPQTGTFARDITFSNNLSFECDAGHATSFHSGGWSAEGGVQKMSNVTWHEQVSIGPCYRVPLLGNTALSTTMRMVGYNNDQSYGQAGSNRGPTDINFDLFNSIWIPGPATMSGPARRWAMEFWLLTDPDQIAWNIQGIRTEQNSYDRTTTSGNHRGATRSTACRDSMDIWTGFCAVTGDSISLEDQRSDTLATAHSAEAVLSFEPITDGVMHRVVLMSGNHRYLTCSGEWELRRDSIDARALSEFLNGTGASVAVNTSADRGAGDPTSGTECSRTSDASGNERGFTDDWEIAQCDSILCLEEGGNTIGDDPILFSGRPALEWFLEGRNTDGSLIGLESGTPFTFGTTTRRLYVVPMVASPLGFNRPDIAGFRIGFMKPGGDSILVVSCTDQGVPADSASVQATLTAWELSTTTEATHVRDRPIPGDTC